MQSCQYLRYKIWIARILQGPVDVDRNYVDTPHTLHTYTSQTTAIPCSLRESI